MGGEIEVVVLEFDEVKQRVSLGLKQKSSNPWVQDEEKYPSASRVKGRVVNITNYGVFVELEKRIEPRTDIADLMTVDPARYALQSSPSQRFPSRGSPLPLSVLLLSCLAPWLFFFATWSWRRAHEQRLHRACLSRSRSAA